MKLLTAAGDYTDTAKASWPLAGLDTPRPVSQAWNSVSLVPLPGGILQTATYSAIFRQNPWVWACVMKLARGLMRLPLKTYVFGADGERERVRGNTPGGPNGANQLDRLLKRPNTDLSGGSMRFATAIDELIYGNALWTIELDESRRVSALWHAPWRRVTVVPGENVPVLKYTVSGTRGKSRDYAPEEVIHFGRGSDPDSPIGISPLEPLARDLGIMDAVARQILAFFGNQARPSGNLKVDGKPSDEVMRFMREQILEMYGAPENAGKVLVTTGDFQPTSTTPEHAKVIEVTKVSREAACAVYDVPPPVIGILEYGVKANVQEMREQFYRDSLGPRASAHEEDLASQLIPRQSSWSRAFVEFDMGEVLRPTPKDEAETLARSDWLTVDEKRQVKNLPPLNLPGYSDRPLVPAGVLPLGSVEPADVEEEAAV
jgi:HK97 family phage portal protein